MRDEKKEKEEEERRKVGGKFFFLKWEKTSVSLMGKGRGMGKKTSVSLMRECGEKPRGIILEVDEKLPELCVLFSSPLPPLFSRASTEISLSFCRFLGNWTHSKPARLQRQLAH